MLWGVWGGASPLPHFMKPWYTYVNSPFIILVSDRVAIHTGKLGILEVEALIKYFIHGHLLNHCQKYSWTTKNADRWPFQGIQYFWWWVIEGTGTLNILDYILYRDTRESIFLWHWSCRYWHMLGGLSCCSYKGNFFFLCKWLLAASRENLIPILSCFCANDFSINHLM